MTRQNYTVPRVNAQVQDGTIGIDGQDWTLSLYLHEEESAQENMSYTHSEIEKCVIKYS